MGLGGVLGWHEKNPTQKKDTKKTVFFLLLKKHVFFQTWWSIIHLNLNI